MKAIIVGAGEVGYHLADRLSKEGHDVVLIERNSDRENFLREKLNAKMIAGNGASAEVLEGAGIKETQLFIAVTDIDEVNMVACLLAQEYGVPKKIARVTSIEYTLESSKLNAHRLGIDLIINPQMVVADEICEMVEFADAVEAAEFADGRVMFLGYSISKNSPLVNKTLNELAWSKDKAPVIVTSIHRGENTIIPRGGDNIEENDVVYFVCKKEDLNNIRYQFGFELREEKNIFVLGAGHVGFEVIKRLADGKHNIKVIDRDEKHCRNIADSIDGVVVLCTSSNDIDTLKSEGIANGDVIIAVTDDDQSNILGSLLAKKHGVKRAITLVNQGELAKLANSLGINVCISPRLATASAILKYIRKGNVLSVLEQTDAEVLELRTPEKGEFLNKPIHSIGLPKGVVIGAIVREDEVIIPSGGDSLKPNDRIIIFTLLKTVTKVEKFFS